MVAAFAHYQNMQVNTSSPAKIMLMLYDGAVNFTTIAINKLSDDDIAGKGIYISKAQAIVAELMNTLNHDLGGETARQLEQLYVYVISEFVAANINNSVQNLENALKIMINLRNTWREAIENAKFDQEASLLSQKRVAF